MADYNITKIVDGLFISDQNVSFVCYQIYRIHLFSWGIRSLECWDGLLNLSIIIYKNKVFNSTFSQKMYSKLSFHPSNNCSKVFSVYKLSMKKCFAA